MVIGLGIDAVDIERFKRWHTYSHATLGRIFSAAEIAYCLQSPRHSAERFAVRFAAREAFFKAWHNAFVDQYIPLLRICKAIQVMHTPQKMAQIEVNWDLLGVQKPAVTLLFSQTHSNTTAIACVILTK